MWRILKIKCTFTKTYQWKPHLKFCSDNRRLQDPAMCVNIEMRIFHDQRRQQLVVVKEYYILWVEDRLVTVFGGSKQKQFMGYTHFLDHAGKNCDICV